MARTSLPQRPNRQSRSMQPALPEQSSRRPPTKWPPEEQRELETLWDKTSRPKAAQKEELVKKFAEALCKKDGSKDYHEANEYYHDRVSNWFKNKRQKTLKRAKHPPTLEGEGDDRSKDSLVDRTNPTSRNNSATPGCSYQTASAALGSTRPVAPVHHYVAYQQAGGCLECHEVTGCSICMTCSECLEARECQQCPRPFDGICWNDKDCDEESKEGCEVARFPVEVSGLLLLASCIEFAGLG